MRNFIKIAMLVVVATGALCSEVSAKIDPKSASGTVLTVSNDKYSREVEFKDYLNSQNLSMQDCTIATNNSSEITLKVLGDKVQ